MLEEKALLSFLEKFDEHTFLVRMNQKEYRIGEGEPAFCVQLRKPIPLQALMRSTSLALGEAYMKEELEIEGNLYQALDAFLSLREILSLAAEYQFHTIDVENLRQHYNRTLLCWEHNFREHRQKVSERYGEEFTRMWELYLSSCAATFHNGIIDLHQILLTKGVNNGLPMTRWY